jgi:capsular polysaccharide biosynthesis protein
MFERPEGWSGAAFSLEEVDDPTGDGGPSISIRALKPALRRRRRLWVSTAVVGLLLGASMHVILPAKYTAVTKLYLFEQSAQGMSDDVALLSTRSVSDQALSIYRSSGGHSAALSPYKGLSLSPSIMSVKLSSSSPADAVAESTALASAFLQTRNTVLSQQTQILVNRLQAQIAPIKTQIQQATAQIDAMPANPVGSQASHLADLVNQRNGLTGQLTSLQNQSQQALNTEASLTQGSRVIDPPRYVPAAKKKVIVKDGLAGLIGGLALGMIIVVIGELLSDRVRRRTDVAAALGTPVELTVGHLPNPRWFATLRLRRALKHRSPALRRVEHRLRNHLESNPIAGLSLVEIEAVKPAALALTALALSLASEGKRVVLFDAAHDRPLGKILRQQPGAERGGMVSIHGQQVALFVAPDDPSQTAWMDCPDDADAILTLATVDPALGAEHMSTSVSEVVVMVRAGAVNAAHLETVSQLLRQALIGVRSVILIQADPNDHTSGLPAYRTADESLDRAFGAVKAVGP